MSNHPGDSQDPFTYKGESAANKTSLLPAVRSLPEVRSADFSQCPNCAAEVATGTSICPHCGEFLRPKAKIIRCRRCGKSASSSLQICPGCGRHLEAAPARALTWGAPALVVLLFLAVLVGRWNRGNPFTWMQSQVASGVDRVQALGDSLSPSISIAIVPSTPISDGLPSDASAAIVAPMAVVSTTESAGAVVDLSSTVSSTVLSTVASPAIDTEETAPVTPTLTSTALPTLAPTLAGPTETPTIVPTVVPPTPPTATPQPTATRAATTTLSSTALASTTLSSPTLRITPSLLASAFVATKTLVLVPTATPSGAQSISVGSRLTTTTGIAKPGAAATVVNQPTSTVAPTNTPLPTPTVTSVPQTVYTVQAGDTLGGIANGFGLASTAIMDANGLTAEDVYRLRPGQTLVIPVAGTTADAPVLPTPANQTYTIEAGDTPIGIANQFDITVDELLAANNLTVEDARSLRVGELLQIPGPTPAVVDAPAATPTALPRTGQFRLDPPQLQSPANSIQVSCSTSNALIWLPVASITDADRYLLHLGFVSARGADGSETVTWVWEQIQSPNNTQWNMDNSLCTIAPQALGSQWRWFVEVIDANRTPISQPSATWGFTWN